MLVWCLCQKSVFIIILVGTWNKVVLGCNVSLMFTHYLGAAHWKWCHTMEIFITEGLWWLRITIQGWILKWTSLFPSFYRQFSLLRSSFALANWKTMLETRYGGWINEVETYGIRGPCSLLWWMCYRVVVGQLLMCCIMQIKLYCVGCWVSLLTLGISIYRWVDWVLFWGTAQECVAIVHIERIWNLREMKRRKLEKNWK